MKKILILLAIFTGTVAWATQPENAGTVNITVLDENGALVQDAPVYIYGEHTTKFVGGKEVPGTTTLSLPAGSYRISSALLKKTGDYYDRFTSHEAHIEIAPGDNTVIVLTLRPIGGPMASIGYAEIKKIGPSTSDLAQNFN